jgi:hypothetical protein
MVRNGKEPENPLNLLVAATFEKAITYVFAESLIRNAEARSSTLLRSTNNLPFLNNLLIQMNGRMLISLHASGCLIGLVSS